MNRSFAISPLIWLMLAPFAPSQESPSYAKHIRPLLAKYCLECHNPKALKGGLDLETFKAMLEGSDRGAILKAGDADASKLVTSLEGKSKSLMPPKSAKFHPRTDEIALVRAWVKAGAKDDSADIKVIIPHIKPRQAAPPPVTALAFHPRGDWLLTAKHQRITRVDPRDGVEVTYHGESAPITALVFSPRGEYWAAAFGKAGTAGSVHHYVFGKPYQAPKALNELHQDAILDLAYSPDGKTLASCSYDTQIKLTQLDDPAKQITLKEHSDSVYAVAFSPDGKLLASCAADRAVKVWNAATGKLLYTLGEATDWLFALAWSGDGRLLASGGADKSIRVHEVNAEGGKLIHSIFAHEAPVLKLAYSRDGKTLFSLGQDRVVKSWDADRMVERRVFDPQSESVLAMAVRPGQPQLALGRYDGAVFLVDANTGKVQAEVKAAPPGKPGPPRINKFGPGVGRRGGKLIVTVEGQGLESVDGVSIDKPGLGVEILHKTKTRDHLELELNPTASTPLGLYQIRLKSAGGESEPRPFVVDFFTTISEPTGNNSGGAAPLVKLPASIAGALDRAGEVDYVRFEVAAGQQLGIQVITAAVGSKVEPVLQLTDARGKVLAESHEGFLGHHFDQAGVYALGLRDREFRGGPGMTYRLHLGPIPIITSVFPLGVQRGASRVIRFRGVNLDQDKFAATIDPKEPLGGKVTVFPDPSQGMPLGAASVVVGEFPDVFPGKKTSSLVEGTIPVPGTANGELRGEGNSHLWEFAAKKGQRLILEVEARRLGSQLDSIIEILDAHNQPVPRAVLRCQAKTFVTFRDHDSASPGIRIEAWGELATNDYLYVGSELLKIHDLPPNPDADCVFYNTGGQRLGFLDTTPSHVSMNLPMYKVTLHPPGSKFPPNGYPIFTLNYRNDDGGPGYGRDSRLVFDPPADAVYRVKIADTRGQGGVNFGYRLTVRSPRPSYQVRFSPANPIVPKGEAVVINAFCDRLDDYDGPIDLELANLPPGFSAPKTTIPAHEYATSFALFADPKATIPAKSMPLSLHARALINGQTLTRQVPGEILRLAEPGEIITSTEQAEVTIKPGGQVKLTVNIERRLGFTGRVPLDVKGLPHGVRVLDIGLNGILIVEGETRRTITIQAEPWVEPTNHPFVVLARREGKNSEHAAKSVLLKVAR